MHDTYQRRPAQQSQPATRPVRRQRTPDPIFPTNGSMGNGNKKMRSPARSATTGPPTLAAAFSSRPARRRGPVVLSERHEVISVVGGELLLDHHRLERHRESHLSMLQRTNQHVHEGTMSEDQVQVRSRPLRHGRYNQQSRSPQNRTATSQLALEVSQSKIGRVLVHHCRQKTNKTIESLALATVARTHRSDKDLRSAGQGVRPALGVHPAQPEPRPVGGRLEGGAGQPNTVGWGECGVGASTNV